ncbi:MAG TPA: BrnA antitoxin family protein [Burkholderiaceae bacterium]|nr:BrnA antitoxin family protein [Burkholderiaceae bacterium]
MSAKPGHVSADEDPATVPDDWNDAFVTHSADELRQAVAARRTRGPNKNPTKEQVAVRYSPEVLAYFRATGAGWQTRMDEVLREYVSQRTAA